MHGVCLGKKLCASLFVLKFENRHSYGNAVCRRNVIPKSFIFFLQIRACRVLSVLFFFFFFYYYLLWISLSVMNCQLQYIKSKENGEAVIFSVGYKKKKKKIKDQHIYRDMTHP